MNVKSVVLICLIITPCMFYKGIKLVLFNWLQNYILLGIKTIPNNKNTLIGVDANKNRVHNNFPPIDFFFMLSRISKYPLIFFSRINTPSV